MSYTIFCKKLGRELPGLDFVPFDDDLGTRIYQNISAEAWHLWLEHSKMLINEYRLDLMTEQAFRFLHERCEAFFFGEGSTPPPDFRKHNES